MLAAPRMSSNRLHATIAAIRKKDNRFSPSAYDFLLQALDYTVGKTPKPPSSTAPSQAQHVSCLGLLEGFAEYAQKKFGPMASTVLREWGIKNSLHVGEIVFQLIKAGILGKHPNDSIEDFHSSWNLHTKLEEPYRPLNHPSQNTL